MLLLIGDLTLGLDTVAGGGVTGMLVYVLVVFMKRTRDVDRRRDEILDLVLGTSSDQEKRLWLERDRALAARDAALAETERVRHDKQAELDELRERYVRLLDHHHGIDPSETP